MKHGTTHKLHWLHWRIGIVTQIMSKTPIRSVAM